MAPAFVKTLGSGASKSSSTTMATSTLSGTVPVGHTVLVSVAGLTQSTVISGVTDSRSNTYVELSGAAGGIDLGISRTGLWGSVVTTQLEIGDTITATWASAISTRTIEAFEVSGTSLTVDVAVVSSEGGTGASVTIGPSATTTVADALAIAIFTASNASNTYAFSPGAGYASAGDVSTGNSGTNRSLSTEYKVLSATGAQTATGTFTSTPVATHSYDAVLVILQASASVTFITASDGWTQADANSGISQSSTESGSLGDVNSGITAAVATTETSALADASSVATAVATTDTWTLSDPTPSIAAAVTALGDPHTQSDANSGIMLPASDALALADANSGIAASMSTVDDPHVLSEGTSNIAPATTDTLSLAEGTSSMSVGATAMEVGTLAEGTTAIALVAVDSGTLSETGAQVDLITLKTGSDDFSMAEGPGVVAAALDATESASILESTNLVVALSALDTFSFGDVNSGLMFFAVDAQTQSEGTRTVSSQVVGVETHTISDIVTGIRLVGPTDSLSQSETIASVSAAVEGSDTEHITDVHTLMGVAFNVVDSMIQSEAAALIGAALSAVDVVSQTEVTARVGPIASDGLVQSEGTPNVSQLGVDAASIVEGPSKMNLSVSDSASISELFTSLAVFLTTVDMQLESEVGSLAVGLGAQDGWHLTDLSLPFLIAAQATDSLTLNELVGHISTVASDTFTLTDTNNGYALFAFDGANLSEISTASVSVVAVDGIGFFDTPGHILRFLSSVDAMSIGEGQSIVGVLAHDILTLTDAMSALTGIGFSPYIVVDSPITGSITIRTSPTGTTVVNRGPVGAFIVKRVDPTGTLDVE